MKNLFKKLLACCLAVCMVLTLCVGAITVGAEAPTGTVTAGTAKITDADAKAVVPVTTYAAGGIAAAEINVAVPENLTISGLELVTTDTKVEVTFASAADPSGAPELLDSKVATSDVAPNVIDGVFTYIIHLPANTVTTAEVTVNITFAGEYAVGTIAVDVVDAEACFDAKSDLIDLTITDGSIEVTAAHECVAGEPVIEKNVDPTCTETGSYEEVVYCTGCGEEMSRETKTVDALGHAWGEGEVTTAPDCENAGVRTFTCANDPAHTKTEAIDPKGHTAAAETVKKDEVAATCTTDGSYRNVVVCAVCGAEISSETIPVKALGHAYGTPVDNGDGTHTATCANNCGIDLTENCSYTNLVCECGAEKAQNSALSAALYSTAMTVGEKFGIYRCFWLEKITNIDFDDFEIVVSKKALDGTNYLYTDEPATFVFDETNAESKSNVSRKLFYYNYNQVSLYELGVDVTYTLYLYKDGEKVEYYSFEPVTFVSIAKDHYDKYIPTVATDASLKQVKMGATLLNVAASAQNYFKKGRPESPLNTFEDPLKGIDQQYIADYSTLTALESPTQDPKFKLMGLQILATPSFRYYYFNKDSKTPAELTLSASYQSLNTNLGEDGFVPKTLKGDNLPGTDGDKGASNGLYYFTFDQIALYDGNKAITLTATDATGTYTFVTSLDTFLVNNISVSGETGDVYRAIASLSACSRIYFPNY